MNESLPRAVRRRVVLGVVVAAVAALAALGVCAYGFYQGVWRQASAEALVSSESPQTGMYVAPGDQIDAPNAPSGDDAWVRLDDGRAVTLWHPEFRAAELSPTTGEKVDVVVFPGEDRAFLLDEVSRSDQAVWMRVVDWVLRIPRAVGIMAVLILGVYVATRVALGFSPFALPSLLRRREGVDAVVTDWRWRGRPDSLVLIAVVGDTTYEWPAVVPSSVPPQLGATARLVGRPRAGGWVVASTSRTVAVPTGRMAVSPARQAPFSAGRR